MKKLLQFFSLAVLTQIILMLSQLILLPIQIRLWGHTATAGWYAAVAVAAITTVVDCGLRTAGHEELLQCVRHQGNHHASVEYFRQIWGWIRILVLAVTLALIAGKAIDCVFTGSTYPVWNGVLTLAYALETVLIIRIMYLDSLGLYRGAEASYFLFAALRLSLAVPALLVLRLGPAGLAWLFLGTAAIALVLQGRLLCREVSVLGIFAALPHRLSIRVLAVARITVAEPVANWVRLSLPVLVISAIASPAAVNTYVALRAAFGASRQTIQQLARVASVEYLRFRAQERFDRAESLLSLAVVGGGLFCTVVSGLIVADNMRIMGVWLRHFDRLTFQMMMLPFVLSGPFYAYQIIVNLQFRVGELPWIARRHYFYVIYSGLFSILAATVKWLPLYLITLAISEIALPVMFMLPDSRKIRRVCTDAGRRGLVAASAGSVALLVLWLAARKNAGYIFEDVSFGGAASSTLFLASILGVAAWVTYFHNKDASAAQLICVQSSGKLLSADDSQSEQVRSELV
jgi:hypothetical protein